MGKEISDRGVPIGISKPGGMEETDLAIFSSHFLPLIQGLLTGKKIRRLK